MNPKINKLIRKGGDPVLKQVAVAVTPGENIESLLDLMQTVCKKSKTGVGLAAPQVGVSKRVIFLLCADDKGTVRGRFMINPEITRQSTQTVVDEEGCLSFPGIVKRIARPTWVEVKSEDDKRRPRTEKLHGFAARVFFHEYDHIQGICKVGDPDYLPDEIDDAGETIKASPKIASHYASRRRNQSSAALLMMAAVGLSAK